MKRDLTRQADLRLRGLCHRLITKQCRTALWVLFVPLAIACVYTAFRPFVDSKNRRSGMEFVEKDPLHMGFIQSIVGNEERKSQENNGTTDETIQAPILKRQEAAE